MGSSESGARTEHASVINGDVAGYSRLIADNEIETHQTLQAFRGIVEASVANEDGRVANFVGDEFLAVLPTQASGLAAALSIQRSLAGENARLPAARQVRFRLGVDYGMVSVENDRWFGEVINIAARLQALAEPGGICASAAALEGGDDLPIRFRPLGRQRLKNIPEPVLAYDVVAESLPEDGANPWRRRIPPPRWPSLAVNPFVNLGDPADDHFADGLMMAVAIELMTLPGLDVIGEASTLRYRDQAHSAQQMAHELGVRYVLEGAVQRNGPDVRVLTQVVDVEKSAIVWADRFEAEITDVFAAQDDIVARIAEALDVEVIGGELARSYRDELDPEAVEIVYRGLHELRTRRIRSVEPSGTSRRSSTDAANPRSATRSPPGLTSREPSADCWETATTTTRTPRTSQRGLSTGTTPRASATPSSRTSSCRSTTGKQHSRRLRRRRPSARRVTWPSASRQA